MNLRVIKRITLTAVCGGIVTAFAAKELMYDPEKGIIFVDKNDATPVSSIAKEKRTQPVEKEPSSAGKRPAKRKSGSDIHIGRKKDPPELYFKSGPPSDRRNYLPDEELAVLSETIFSFVDLTVEKL